MLRAAQAIADSSKKIKWAVGLKPNLDSLPAGHIFGKAFVVAKG